MTTSSIYKLRSTTNSERSIAQPPVDLVTLHPRWVFDKVPPPHSLPEYERDEGRGWIGRPRETQHGAVNVRPFLCPLLRRQLARSLWPSPDGDLPRERNMAKNDKTSPKAATASSKVLKSRSMSKDANAAVGSALTQAADKRRKK